MQQIISITSQGQVSIPANMRRQLNLDKNKKAFISLEKGKILIEPARDFLTLKGSLKTDKKISNKKIKEKFGDYLASRVK